MKGCREAMALSDSTSAQRVTRLTPLDTILGLIAKEAGAVGAQKSPVEAALGQVLAEDVVASQLPPRAIALRDGFAVEAAALADVGPYAPVTLPRAARRIDVGEPLPDGADAVLPLDAVSLRGDRAEAVAAVAAGEGVLPAGGDATPATPLRRAGERLRAIDVAVLRAAGTESVTVRVPRIGIVRGGAASAPMTDAALAALKRVIAASGGVISEPKMFETALTGEQTDAVIAVGGTGSGQRDSAVQTLASLGRVEAHGIAVSPGETAALGFVGKRPVLLIPGRLDAALSVWLLIGRYVLARLAGGSVEDFPAMLPLKRKVTSTIGLCELIPVICSGGVAEPLASGYLSLTALTRSDGWIVVPAGSEGFAAGTQVAVRPWP
jgi:molybdopterin molybdotransferase